MVTVPGALMDAATSAGVLRTTESLNPELLAAVLMALMILAAKPTSGLERVYVDSQSTQSANAHAAKRCASSIAGGASVSSVARQCTAVG
jgi:hypothetical protein